MSAAETTELTTVADDLAVFHRGEEVIRHANTFALGALRAAQWAVGRPPGIYSMQDVLGLH